VAKGEKKNGGEKKGREKKREGNQRVRAKRGEAAEEKGLGKEEGKTLGFGGEKRSNRPKPRNLQAVSGGKASQRKGRKFWRGGKGR